jgi:molybdopterin synthase catalytic subunit
MIRVQREDFDIGAELARFGAGNARIGGVAVFVGLVRDLTGVTPPGVPSHDAGGGRTKPVGAMTLEHYPGMTEKELAAIEAEARGRWPLEDVLVIHRFGRLEPGDRIVLVATASAHREAAFESCHFLIDWLKTKAPFWKREETPAGGQWVAARDSDDAAAKRWTQAAKTGP